jgi:hypothetical protein
VDRIITIARWQWRAWWRRIRRTGHLNAGNQGILLIFSILILTRYLQSLHVAAGELPLGRTRVFESLLFGIFLVWLFPLASSARSNNAIRKLQHLPLTQRELFVLKLLTLLFPPYAWIVLGGSLAIAYPIFRAPNRAAGLAAAGLFIAFAAFTGVTAAQLLSRRLFRKLLFAAVLLSGLVVFYLAQTEGRARVLSLAKYLPTTLVASAALAPNPWLAVLALAGLAMLMMLTTLAALWSFKLSLESTQKQRTQKLARFGLLAGSRASSLAGALRLGAVGGLAAKDFRYFRRLLDPYLGVLVAALGCLYLLTADAASAGVFQIFLLSVFVPNAALAFNLFGLDNRAVMDRLKLMPVTGRSVLLGKNLAFVGVVGVQVLPLILLACWRLGFLIGTIGVLEAASLAAMYLTWGNWMSVNCTFKLQFFQFSSSTGAVMEAMAGIVFGSLPGVVAIYALRAGGIESAWKIAAVVFASGAFYYFSLWRFSIRFEQKRDKIAAALS